MKDRGLYHLTAAGEEHARTTLSKLLSVASQTTSSLVVLPELSVPESCLAIAQAWSEQTGAVVVAGSHYLRSTSKSRSRCPVIIAGRVHIVEKISPAPAELSPVPNHGIEPGNAISVFLETPVGNLAVLICSDYLDQELRRLAQEGDLDFLVVPAFQRQSDVYHARFGVDCDQSQRGIYGLYANNQLDQMADGRSAIFGQMDSLYTSELIESQYTDGAPPTKLVEFIKDQPFVVCDFNIDHRKPYAKRTVGVTAPNLSIVQSPAPNHAEDLQFEVAIGHADYRYSRISELFVPPREYPLILDVLERSKLVFIVGDPGLGKTYTAVQLLKHYYQKGYKPSWWVGLERKDRAEQRKTLEHFQPKPMEIVYFEDPFGRTVFENRDSLRRAFRPILDSLTSLDARVVVTSRREVFEQFLNEAVSSDELRALSADMNIVSPSYDPDRLYEMFRKLNSHAEHPISDADSSEIEAVIRSGHIATPLALFDLAHSTASASGREEILQRVRRRGLEQVQLFGEEIVACPDSTKLVLALVFLFGAHPVSLLHQAYETAATSIGLRPNRIPTLMEELRAQKGHRIEQFGARTLLWRFVHPLYEEALVDSSERDRDTRSALAAVARAVAIVNPRVSLSAVAHQALRYPHVALRLADDVLPFLIDRRNIEDLILGALHLQHLARVTKLQGFATLTDRLLAPSELSSRLIDLDIRLTAPALRLLCNSDTGKQFVDQIDWAALAKKWRTEPIFSKVVDVLQWVDTLHPETVRSVLEEHPDLLTAVSKLSDDDRYRLRRLLNWRGGKAVRKIVDATPSQRGVGGRAWIRMMASTSEGMIIDDGAVTAIRAKRNLLPVGITGVLGKFDIGEPVTIFDGRLRPIAAGVTNFTSEEVERIKGQHSSLVPEILEFNSAYRTAVIAQARLALIEMHPTAPLPQ